MVASSYDMTGRTISVLYVPTRHRLLLHPLRTNRRSTKEIWRLSRTIRVDLPAVLAAITLRVVARLPAVAFPLAATSLAPLLLAPRRHKACMAWAKVTSCSGHRPLNKRVHLRLSRRQRPTWLRLPPVPLRPISTQQFPQPPPLLPPLPLLLRPQFRS